MMLRLASRGVSSRAALSALIRQHPQQSSCQQLRQVYGLPRLPSCAAGQQRIERAFGVTAESSKPSERHEDDIEADKEYFMSLGLPEELAEVLARREEEFALDAEHTTAVENALLQKARELQWKRSSRTGGADKTASSASADEGPTKEPPSVAALVALGLPEDVADILANEDIEYPLLAERIVAIENALLAAAAEGDQARGDAEAARSEAASERRETERQTGIVQELKAQLQELENRLKSVVNRIITRGVLDREEDKMEYGGGTEAEEKGREDRELKRIERWARWVEENPGEAAAMAENAGWRPQDIPREVAALYEALRDHDDLGEPDSDASPQESSSGAAGAADGGKKEKEK